MQQSSIVKLPEQFNVMIQNTHGFMWTNTHINKLGKYIIILDKLHSEKSEENGNVVWNLMSAFTRGGQLTLSSRYILISCIMKNIQQQLLATQSGHPELSVVVNELRDNP